MTLFADTVTAAFERGLTGVAARQRVTADNLANAETPGFIASQVDFETNLAVALERGETIAAPPAVTYSTDGVGINGNNVSVEKETTAMIRSGLQYDALVSALNYKLGLLRTAITSR